MATRNSSSKGGKPVIEHDPLAATDESASESENETAAEQAAPTKKVVKKAAKKAAPKKSEAETAAGAASFELGESLTIVEVAEAHQRLLGLLDTGEPISFDGAALEGVDGAGLQLLAAFMQDARGQGVKVSWAGVSDALRAAADQVGLAGVLNINEG